MLQTIRFIFSKPQLSDPDKNRIAQLIWAMNLSYVGGALFICSLFIYLVPEEWWLSTTILGIVLTLSTLSFYLLSKNNIERASHLVIANLYQGLVMNAWFYDGIQGINGAAFILLLIITGLLLGTRALKRASIVTIVTMIVLYYCEQIGLIQNTTSSPIQLTDLGMLIATLGVAALLLHTAISSIDKGYSLLNHTLNTLRRTTVSKTYLDNIIASMQDMLFVIGPDTRIEKTNQAVTQLLGYKEHELLQQPLHILLAPQDQVMWRGPTSLDSPLFALRDTEIKMVTKDGSVIYTAVSTSIMQDAENNKTSILCIANDITQRKQVEMELAAAKDKAEEAARAKSEFLASMSHEIRTPLNAVIGMTSLLLDTSLTAEQEDYVNTARASGSGLLAIIKDILDFSKVDSGKLELDLMPFNLRDCVEQAVDLVATLTANKQILLNTYIDSAVPATIQGDVTRLRQILVNLLNNAIKFTEAGEVNLWVGSKQNEAGHHLHFMVRDTGIGIPADKIPHLFQAFRQLDSSTTRKFGGTGLGLAICKQLVNLMGGEIWVESQPGEGSIFQFTIQVNAQASDLESAPASPPPFQGKRVFVAQPNFTSCITLSRQLTVWGAEPICAPALEKAVHILQNAPEVDLLIVDQAILQSDNKQALFTAIKRVAAATPLLILTPLGQQYSASERFPSAKSLNRPYQLQQLRRQIETLLAAKSQPSRTPNGHVAQSMFDKTLGQTHPLRILLAEDNLINQKVALRMLERLGYQADLAKNGREAVEALAQQPYDLILMDIQMPEMDGIEATRHIREKQPDEQQPRIVALTANALVGDRETYLANGMNDYISKPMKVEALTRVLQDSYPLKNGV